MTLLMTLISAVIATVIWYSDDKARKMKVGLLCYMYWGASLMWLVDAFFEYKELGADFFTPVWSDMLNDAFLGLSVTVLALIVWVVYVLFKDPDGVVRNVIRRNTVDIREGK